MRNILIYGQPNCLGNSLKALKTLRSLELFNDKVKDEQIHEILNVDILRRANNLMEDFKEGMFELFVYNRRGKLIKPKLVDFVSAAHANIYCNAYLN